MRIVCLCLCLLASTINAPAAEITDIYRAEVPVSGKEESARTEDFRRALNRALARLVPPGDLDAAIKAVADQPERLVLKFEYAVRPSASGGGTLLKVDFDPARLREVLRARRITVWGEQRPDVMVWVVIQDSLGERLASADQTPTVDATLRHRADAISLPVTLPLGDLADQQSLSPDDVENGNADRIRIASERYEADVVLTGRIASQTGGEFQADWRLYRGNGEDRWNGHYPDMNDALRSGIDGAFTRLATRLAPAKAETASVELRISGIASLDDANRAAAYLRGLGPVGKLEWRGLGAGDVTFRLDVRGGSGVLQETLALGGPLRPAAGETGFSGLTYQWVR